MLVHSSSLYLQTTIYRNLRMSSRPKDQEAASPSLAKKPSQTYIRVKPPGRLHQPPAPPPSSSTDSRTSLRQKYDTELANLITAKEQQQKDSAAQIKQLQTQVAAAHQERDAQSIRANALADENLQLKRKFKAVRAEKSQAEDRCASALSEAATANEQIEDLTSDLQAAREDVAQTKKDVLRQQNHQTAMREIYAKVQAELLAVSCQVRESSAAQEKHIEWMESRTNVKGGNKGRESGPSKRFKIISSPQTEEDQPTASSSPVHSSPSTNGRHGSATSKSPMSLLADAKAEVMSVLRRFDQAHVSLSAFSSSLDDLLIVCCCCRWLFRVLWDILKRSYLI